MLKTIFDPKKTLKLATVTVVLISNHMGVMNLICIKMFEQIAYKENWLIQAQF